MTLLEAIDLFRLEIADFLKVDLIQTSLISIDLWSVVHFLTGMLVMWMIFKYGLARKREFSFLFMLLLAYEIFEFTLYSNYSHIVRDETAINVAWDMIAGYLGGMVYFGIRNKVLNKSRKK